MNPRKVRILMARLGEGYESSTMKLARATLPGMPNYRLGTLAEQLRIPVGRAHRALADARVALGVLHACLATRPGMALAELHGKALVL